VSREAVIHAILPSARRGDPKFDGKVLQGKQPLSSSRLFRLRKQLTDRLTRYPAIIVGRFVSVKLGSIENTVVFKDYE
jgi:hypothetical protein